MFSKLFLHARVSAQILLKFRMVLPVLFVLGQRGILGELLGDSGMAAQELSKACEFSLRCVVIAVHTFVAMEALLLAHEAVGVFCYLLADLGMLLQIFLESGMVLNELTVFDQGWILPQLFRDLRMAVEEAIHAGKFAPGQIAVAGIL